MPHSRTQLLSRSALPTQPTNYLLPLRLLFQRKQQRIDYHKIKIEFASGMLLP